jgi:GT2 family glycosyltransferase
MISAIVLAYNRCAEVLITIGKLKEFAVTLPFPMEIIVVDNESTDNTTEQIKLLHPDIKLVTKEKNNGIAGWNDGFKIASYKNMLVLDDDSHPEWGIVEAVDYLERTPDTGILALNITSGPYLTDEWVWKSGKPWQDGEEILGFFGCGAIIRKEVYDKIGGFAEWMLVYGHEWDYGIRCIDAGYKIKYFRNSSINHRASSINRSLKRARIFGTRNDMAIVYKYFGYKRWNYIATMFFNNIKRIKHESFKSAYYDILGCIEFLKFRHNLTPTPVSRETQKFFADNYMNTHPVFGFITKRLKSQVKNLGANNQDKSNEK